MAAFRSLWVPLVSAVFNLLSISRLRRWLPSSRRGIGASLIGVDSGVPIMSFIPVMIFAILFGLSMDYNVFLLSHPRGLQRGVTARESVIHGLLADRQVILFAGLIMASVFRLRDPG